MGASQSLEVRASYRRVAAILPPWQSGVEVDGAAGLLPGRTADDPVRRADPKKQALTALVSEDEINLGKSADPPPLRSSGINRMSDDFASIG
jgi:hypothetical protein